MQCGDWEEYNHSVQPQKSPETRPADVTDRMTSEEEQLKLGSPVTFCRFPLAGMSDPRISA